MERERKDSAKRCTCVLQRGEMEKGTCVWCRLRWALVEAGVRWDESLNKGNNVVNCAVDATCNYSQRMAEAIWLPIVGVIAAGLSEEQALALVDSRPGINTHFRCAVLRARRDELNRRMLLTEQSNAPNTVPLPSQ